MNLKKKKKKKKTEKGKKRRLERNERGTQNILRTGFWGAIKEVNTAPGFLLKSRYLFKR